MKPWTLALSILIAATVSISSSFGETVTLAANGLATGVTGLNVTAKVGTQTYTTNEAGLFQWTLTGSGDVGGTSISSLAVNNSIYTFCIQMGQDFSTSYWSNPYTFNVVSINNSNPTGGYDTGYIDTVAAGQMQLLADRYSKYLSLSGSQTINGSSFSAGEIAAAFQLSLWEIEYDGGAGTNRYATYSPESFPSASYFGGGNFTVSATTGTSGAEAIGLAHYFLDTFTLNTTGVDTTYSSFALTNGNAQDQFLSVSNITPQVNSVPLPAALPVGASFLLGLAVINRFRAKRHA
jgi:hypothetical protein